MYSRNGKKCRLLRLFVKTAACVVNASCPEKIWLKVNPLLLKECGGFDAAFRSVNLLGGNHTIVNLCRMTAPSRGHGKRRRADRTPIINASGRTINKPAGK